jgi:hypothetical protein
MPSVSKPDAIQLQPRDFALLRSLFECRIMTLAHISTIFFGGKQEGAKKRMQKLKAAGFIAERRRHVSEPPILFLSTRGFRLLKAEGILHDYPKFDIPSLEKRAQVSDLTIRHELEVMDVKAAFHSVLPGAQNLSLKEFTTWPLLSEFSAPRSFGGGEMLVKPDGFILVEEKGEGTDLWSHSFFLEVDRSTEVQETLVNRIAGYNSFYRSGGFAERSGGNRSEFKEYPFRVLIVFKSAERRNNCAEGLLRLNPPILTLAYLTTITEAKADPTGAIWIRPLEYREAIKRSPFDVEGTRQSLKYRRSTERETFIEGRVQKKSLFAD